MICQIVWKILILECLQMTLPLLLLPGKTIQQINSKINCDLINIKQWLLANKLSLNLTKTEYLVIGSPFNLNNLTSEPNIMIDNATWGGVGGV